MDATKNAQSRKFLGNWPITQHLRERQGPVHGLGLRFYSKNNTNHIITHICIHAYPMCTENV